MQLPVPGMPQENGCEVVNVSYVFGVLGSKQLLLQALIKGLVTAVKHMP